MVTAAIMTITGPAGLLRRLFADFLPSNPVIQLDAHGMLIQQQEPRVENRQKLAAKRNNSLMADQALTFDGHILIVRGWRQVVSSRTVSQRALSAAAVHQIQQSWPIFSFIPVSSAAVQ